MLREPLLITQECWKPVVGHEGYYEVSDHGRVRSLPRIVERATRWNGTAKARIRGRLLKGSHHQDGRHLTVTLSVEAVHRQVFVHVLVLEAFVGPCPDGMECRHLDGRGSNNMLDNLKWGTRLENMEDRTRLGEHNPPRGTRNHRAVLDEEKVRDIRQRISRGDSHSVIANELGINRSLVGKISTRRTWAWLQ